MTTFLGIYVTIGLFFSLLLTLADNMFRKNGFKYKNWVYWTAFIMWVVIWPVQLIGCIANVILLSRYGVELGDSTEMLLEDLE